WRITWMSSHRAPGYSRSKASACGARPRVAPRAGAPPWRCGAGAFSSHLGGDLDPGCTGHPGAAHRLFELSTAGEPPGGVEGGEAVDDEHVVLVARVGHHLGA